MKNKPWFTNLSKRSDILLSSGRTKHQWYIVSYYTNVKAGGCIDYNIDCNLKGDNIMEGSITFNELATYLHEEVGSTKSWNNTPEFRALSEKERGIVWALFHADAAYVSDNISPQSHGNYLVDFLAVHGEEPARPILMGRGCSKGKGKGVYFP